MRGYARGETPNPCVRCNGDFRFDELLRFARRIGAARLATGHYARIVERDGALAIASRRRRREGPELHARDARPGRCSTVSGSRSASRRSRRRAPRPRPPGSPPPGAPRARRPASSAATTTGAFLARQRPRDRPGPRSSTKPARRSARTTGYWRFTPGQRRGLGIAAAEPLYALATDARHEHRRRRAARLARADARAGPRPALRGRRAGSRRSSATARRPSAPPSRRPPRGSSSCLDEPAYGVAPRPDRRSLRRRGGRRRGRHRRRRGRVGGRSQ